MNESVKSNNKSVFKRALRWLKIVVTVLLIVYVVNRAGVLEADGRARFVGLIEGINIKFLVLSFLISVLMNLVSSIKWHVLTTSRNLDVGLPRLFALYYVGKFFNLFLPTMMGGDVARVYQLGKITGTNSEALASVFLERFTGMIVFTVISTIAVFISFNKYDIPIITASLLLCVAITTVITWLILDLRPLKLFVSITSGRIQSLKWLVDKMVRTHEAINAYSKDIRTLRNAFAISLIFYFLAVINVFVSALAFSDEIDFLTIVVAVPAIMLIMNLPVSIGGLGLMEAAYAIIFSAFGYGNALALSTALLIRLKTLVDGLVGGLLYLIGQEPVKTATKTNR